MNRLIRIIVMISALSAQATADPLAPEQVPEPLKPWIDWVLRDHPDRICPFLYNSFERKRCAWPTELRLDFEPKKGRFRMEWTVYQDSWVSLPGDGRQWPLNVTAGRETALVMDRDGVPSIRLKADRNRPVTYRIDGEFFWDRIPDSLAIPADSGLIKLGINGTDIANPAVREGQIWLKDSKVGQKRTEKMESTIDLQVFRRISDEVPIQVLTRLVIEVSGDQREVRFDKPLLNGFVPLAMQSPLPARLEPDGRLLMQVRPGRWQMDLLSRSTQDMNVMALNTSGRRPGAEDARTEPWPRAEIWVFEAHPELRIVEIEEVPAVDSSQTNLPEEWKMLPAYKIEQGQRMLFKKIRRGDPEPEPSRLSLSRILWLDFDGGGYTIHDQISGTMTRDWRLNALPQTQLGRVTLDGNNQLITQLDGSGRQGVEIRKGSLLLAADSRSSGAINRISAVGWEQSFHAVQAELNLPPGWRLLAARGVDNIPDSWLSRWTLLDLFLVLIAAMAVGRLWASSWGGFALVTLAVSWHEPGSPQYIWLNLLAAGALVRLLPEGRFLQIMKVYCKGSWLVFILIALPFLVDQVRTGLYPQLEKPRQSVIAPHIQESKVGPQTPEAAAVMEEMADQAISRSKNRTYSGAAPVGGPYRTDNIGNYDRIDPGAKVQTGPGLPQWQWNRIRLSWNGSVDAGQELDLWYLSPAVNCVLNFLRAVFVSVLALVLFGMADKLRFRWGAANPVLFWFAFMPLLTVPAEKVYADFPDQAMLESLKNALLEPPDCLPGCVRIPSMNLEASDRELTLTLTVQASESVALPLPADYEQWFPNRVTVDGEPVSGLYRDGQALWITLPKGTHRVVMGGAAPLLNKFILPLPMKPNRAVFSGTGWRVAGIDENGLASNQLQFTRVNSASENPGVDVPAAGIFPPFVRVERILKLGLDWRVATRIIRLWGTVRIPS